MALPHRPVPFWARLPRWLFWVVGAAVSFAGALIAKGLGDQVSLDYRWPFWLAGTAAIFVGLWIMSFGTKSRLDAARGRQDRNT